MTFNIFEAIEEVQGILNALEANIPDTLRNKAFKGEITPAKYEELRDKYYEKFPASKQMHDFTTSEAPLAKRAIAKASAPAQIKSIERKAKEGKPELLKTPQYKGLKAAVKESFLSQILSLREEFSSIFEDVHSAIDKKYPKYTEENKELHRKANEVQSRNKQEDMERDLGKYTSKSKSKVNSISDLFTMPDIDFDSDDEERTRKETEWETKRYFKPMSKNEKGIRNNHIQQFGTSDEEGISQAKVARRALGKRKAKSIKESILSLKEEFSSIFEGSQKEVNKIKKVKTHTDPNEPTEVVSVADELFPREGNAKQQYNQKVLDIINGMIEGSSTLEDLIQFVRKQKVNGVKESLDKFEEHLYNERKSLILLEEIINELKDSTLRSAYKMAAKIAAEQEDFIPKAKDKKYVKKEAARRKHQSAKIENYYENQVGRREDEKYRKPKEGNKSKEE